MATLELPISHDAELELNNIHEGAFAPLQGFMVGREYRSVVENCRLQDGSPWTIPITLDVNESIIDQVHLGKNVFLMSGKQVVGELFVEDLFEIEPEEDAEKIFGLYQREHPGVLKEMERSRYRVGGRTRLIRPIEPVHECYEFSPDEVRKIFQEAGLKSVAGFQTRNPIHRAHEHLQRVALEYCDGLFVQPLIGWKKQGDISAKGVLAGYQVMFEQFYPKGKTLLGTLRTPMRYAGPREAVFHAIIRRNYGCTHFIIGRDHAGVGGYYGKYEAQEFAKQFDDLGIEILALGGPYYCKKCGMIVTERHCHCGMEYQVDVSGTKVREALRQGNLPEGEIMRGEVAKRLMQLHKEDELFIREEKGGF